jgi:hypothetical protein
MSIEAYFEIKDELRANNVRFDSTQEALVNLGYSYPYYDSLLINVMDTEDNGIVDYDNVSGDNFKGFTKRLNAFIRKLNSRLPKGIKPIFDRARLDKSFKFKEENESVVYYPFVIEFDDGQQLIGLARQYGDDKNKPTINFEEAIKITKWYLNGANINKVVFKDRGALEDVNKQVQVISKLVEKNHTEFIKKYPNLQFNTDDEIKTKIEALKSENEELRKQIEEAKKEKEQATQELQSQDNQNKTIQINLTKAYKFYAPKIKEYLSENKINDFELSYKSDEVNIKNTTDEEAGRIKGLLDEFMQKQNDERVKEKERKEAIKQKEKQNKKELQNLLGKDFKVEENKNDDGTIEKYIVTHKPTKKDFEVAYLDNKKYQESEDYKQIMEYLAGLKAKVIEEPQSQTNDNRETMQGYIDEILKVDKIEDIEKIVDTVEKSENLYKQDESLKEQYDIVLEHLNKLAGV